MASTYTTLTDLVKLNDQNARDLGVQDILNESPVLKVLAATTASNGTSHKYIKWTTAPTVGFRTANTGKFNGNSSYTEVSIALANIDASQIVDTIVADAYKGGPIAFVERESMNALKQAFFTFEQQIWYGTGAGAAAGFAGVNDTLSALSNAMVVNAGGTTAATGSSVYAIRSTGDERNLTAVIGNTGEISIGESVITLKPDDADSTKSYPVYFTPIQAWLGLQLGSVYSVARLCNATADSGKGVTDALISSLISVFPAYAPPTHIAMNRRSLMQLQKSRTTYNPFGAPAAFPQDVFGIPIVVTDSISSTEALVS